MKWLKLIKWIWIPIVAVGVLAFTWCYRDNSDSARVNIKDAKIVNIEPMIRLCTVEISEDIPVRGDIDDRHFFGRMAVNGTIGFDLDSVGQEWVNDTLVVTLPREKVEIFESTEPGAYEVIDTWNDHFFGSSNFTTAEENKLKKNAIANFRSNMYKRGYVARARREAVENLTGMLVSLTHSPVKVIDPIPAGTPR